MMERALAAPTLSHVYLDISWAEVAKYVVASPEAVQATADLISGIPTAGPDRRWRRRTRQIPQDP
jgi:hypothetical protein